MKTQTQNNSGTGKSLMALLLILLFTSSSAFALNNNDSKNPKVKTKTEESVDTEELMTEIFEIEELDFATENLESAFQVMDAQDKLIFSGSKKEWENKENKKLITMKRKAEFLFESNGTQIYKVF